MNLWDEIVRFFRPKRMECPHCCGRGRVPNNCTNSEFIPLLPASRSRVNRSAVRMSTIVFTSATFTLLIIFAIFYILVPRTIDVNLLKIIPLNTTILPPVDSIIPFQGFNITLCAEFEASNWNFLPVQMADVNFKADYYSLTIGNINLDDMVLNPRSVKPFSFYYSLTSIDQNYYDSIMYACLVFPKSIPQLARIQATIENLFGQVQLIDFTWVYNVDCISN